MFYTWNFNRLYRDHSTDLDVYRLSFISSSNLKFATINGILQSFKFWYNIKNSQIQQFFSADNIV